MHEKEQRRRRTTLLCGNVSDKGKRQRAKNIRCRRMIKEIVFGVDVARGGAGISVASSKPGEGEEQTKEKNEVHKHGSGSRGKVSTVKCW